MDLLNPGVAEQLSPYGIRERFSAVLPYHIKHAKKVELLASLLVGCRRLCTLCCDFELLAVPH